MPCKWSNFVDGWILQVLFLFTINDCLPNYLILPPQEGYWKPTTARNRRWHLKRFFLYLYKIELKIPLLKFPFDL